jgi:hypothetical protein
MSATIAAIADCIMGASEEDRACAEDQQALINTRQVRPLDEVAQDVDSTILRAEKAGAGLKSELNAIVGPYGWKEYLAEKVLEKLGGTEFRITCIIFRCDVLGIDIALRH